jgi:hypothetical protein
MDQPERRSGDEVLRRLFLVRSRLCWLERSRTGTAAEIFTLSVERDVLEWVLGDRASPPLALPDQDPAEPSEAGA